MQSRGKKRKYSIVFGWPTIETTEGRDSIRRRPFLYYFSIFFDFVFDPPTHYVTIIKWVWHTQSFCWRYIYVGMVPINPRISAKTLFRGCKDQVPWDKVLEFSWRLVLKPKHSKFVLIFKVMKSNSGKHYFLDKD